MKSNNIEKLIKGINNTKEETENINRDREIIENEIKEKITRYKSRFKKLGEQLESETLIKYINEDEELNKLVYKVYKVLKDLDYKHKK